MPKDAHKDVRDVALDARVIEVHEFLRKKFPDLQWNTVWCLLAQAAVTQIENLEALKQYDFEQHLVWAEETEDYDRLSADYEESQYWEDFYDEEA